MILCRHLGNAWLGLTRDHMCLSKRKSEFIIPLSTSACAVDTRTQAPSW